ncbi:AMP-binding protein [Spongiibacter taiwanensis]|uniref:AMP-binding protein n=1 Tax=Spongiibacter taiwanensis TaxID=1748242 RepID=UPI002036386D|nr:AMP-binding protein [Spongiibacter taiwanensis]USA42632.1 AMP-binding protein [Spongiibacter taiwanensis]
MNLAQKKLKVGVLYPGALLPEKADKPAVIMADSRHQLTYRQLDAFANRLGRLFQWRGLKAGQQVVYLCRTRLECLWLQWGAHYAGLRYTFIDPNLAVDRLRTLLSDCAANAVVVDGQTPAEVITALRSMANSPRVYSLDLVAGLPLLEDEILAFDTAPLGNALEGMAMACQMAAGDGPRALRGDQRPLPLGSTLPPFSLPASAADLSDETVYLSLLPHHRYETVKWCQGVSALGGTVVMMTQDAPETILATINRYRVSHGVFDEGTFRGLLALPASVRARYDVSSLRAAVHCAGLGSSQLAGAMMQWWGPVLYQDQAAVTEAAVTQEMGAV